MVASRPIVDTVVLVIVNRTRSSLTYFTNISHSAPFYLPFSMYLTGVFFGVAAKYTKETHRGD